MRAAGVFPDALETREELERFARDVPGLLLANMTEFGRTPLIPAGELGAMGYKLVLFPVTLQRVAMNGVQDCLHQLRRAGTQRDQLDRMQTRAELYDLLGYDIEKTQKDREPEP